MGEEEDFLASYYPKPWYASFWKVLLLVVLFFVGLAVILFGLLIYQEYSRIQKGETPLYLEAEPTNDATNGIVTNTTSQSSGGATIVGSKSTSMALDFTPGPDDDPYMGTPGAPVEIIAFEDFQCPYCKEAVPIVKNVVEKNFSNVHFVYRDFPLYTIHAQARPAAEAAECADEQGKFWAYHDLIFEQQSQMATANFFSTLAEQAGLDLAAFEQCVTEQRYTQEVQQDLDEGLLAGASATPTFIINGVKYQGVLSESQFQQIIDAELTE